MIRSTWYGRLLCRLGLHRYEWRTRVVGDSDALVTECRCRRISCPVSRRWMTVDVERRPW